MAMASANTDTRDLLPNITVPTLLIWGTPTLCHQITVAHQVHDAIPGAGLVIIPGARHAGNLEQPALF